MTPPTVTAKGEINLHTQAVAEIMIEIRDPQGALRDLTDLVLEMRFEEIGEPITLVSDGVPTELVLRIPAGHVGPEGIQDFAIIDKTDIANPRLVWANKIIVRGF